MGEYFFFSFSFSSLGPLWFVVMGLLMVLEYSTDSRYALPCHAIDHPRAVQA